VTGPHDAGAHPHVARVYLHEPLAGRTTLGVGGPAERFVEVDDPASLAGALAEARLEGSPLLVLGAGSNVVIADEGFAGTVVRVAMVGRRVEHNGEGVVVSVAAGEDWSSFVSYCVAEGFSGLECLSGIPGSVGATPVQNVGAYGQEVRETVAGVTVWDRFEHRARHLSPGDCQFGYRDSVFKRSGRYVVTEVTFCLERSALSRPLRYAELAKLLGVAVGSRAPLDVTSQAVISLRRVKGMVLDSSDPDSRSVGSFFTNPVLDAAAMSRLAELAPAVPRFAVPDGTKVPAAWLVEHAGFARGYRRGLAAISTKHALAITAGAGCSAADVVALAKEVRDGVRVRFGVLLVPEPALVGVHL